MSNKNIDLTEIEQEALGSSLDYSEFEPNNRSTKRPDKLPNRIARFWLYLNSCRSNKDHYIIISRERACYDLQIKDVTLTDYINGTSNYKHLWQRNGGFFNFSTLYGGNLMVVFAGYKKTKDGDIVAVSDRIRGSLLELTPSYKKKQESYDSDNYEQDEDLDYDED